MTDFSNFLKENLNGVFATIEDGKVKTRIFQYLFSIGNKVYFCTENNKAVYEQIKKNPNISFCSHTFDFSKVLSINGKATFVDDTALKTRVLDEYPGIKEIFKTVDNPLYELFYVDVEEVDTFSFTEGARKEKI